VIFSGNEFLAIKVAAVATPVAGLAAVAHLRTRRRRARDIDGQTARHVSRMVVIDVEVTGEAGPGTVSIELTPQLLACLAAARSAHLPGYPTPDTVMMAPRVEALWRLQRGVDVEEIKSAGKAIVTREFLKIRSSSPPVASIPVTLRQLLDAHRRTAEGLPLRCRSDGVIGPDETRPLRVGAARSRKDFYGVRAESASRPPPASPR
jgi:hypothetical protein